jgi:type II secretory pathway pseudopilin PulG
MRIESATPVGFALPISQCRAGSRTGFTLLEMIAVMSTLLLLGIAATTMLTSVTDIGLQHRRAMEERSAVLRFAEILREDVDGSIDVIRQNEAWPLRVIRADEVVEYGWNASSRELTRVARLKSDQGKTEMISSTDLFPLTGHSDPRVEIEEVRVRVVLREPGRNGAWIVEANR